MRTNDGQGDPAGAARQNCKTMGLEIDQKESFTLAFFPGASMLAGGFQCGESRSTQERKFCSRHEANKDLYKAMDCFNDWN